MATVDQLIWESVVADKDAEIVQLRAALKECADDLEASVNAEYAGTLDYPSQKRKYDRDMKSVVRARELIK